MRNPGKLAGILGGVMFGAVAMVALGANHVGWWSLLGLPACLAVCIGLGALIDRWA